MAKPASKTWTRPSRVAGNYCCLCKLNTSYKPPVPSSYTKTPTTPKSNVNQLYSTIMTSQHLTSSSHGSTPATLPPDTPIVRPRELLLGGGSGSTVGHSTASTQGVFTTSQQPNTSSTLWNSSTIDDRDYNRAAVNTKQSLLNLSTQFRHWRFSFEHLDKIREDLNAVAVAALRDAGAGGDVRPSYLVSSPMSPLRSIKGYHPSIMHLWRRVSA